MSKMQVEIMTTNVFPNFFNPTLNIKMSFGERIPKMGTFSVFVTIFFLKCYNKI